MSHPGAVFLGEFTPGSDEWHAERCDRLGGSEVGSIMGVGYSSLYKVYWQKRGLVFDEENAAMEWGRRDEPGILEKFFENHPELRQVGRRGQYVRADRDWQLASPDALYSHADGGFLQGLVEAKTSDHGDGFGEPGTDQVPPGYLAQVLWNCDTMGVDEAWLPVRIGRSTYREYRFTDVREQYAEEWRLIMDHAERFIERLHIGPEPQPDDGSAVTYEFVRLQHPEIDRGVWHETDVGLAGSYLDSITGLTVATEENNRQKSLLLHAMDRAQYAVVTDPESKVTTKIALRMAKRKADGSPGVPYLKAIPNTLRMFSDE